MDEFSADLYTLSFELPKFSWYDRQVKLIKMIKIFQQQPKEYMISAVTKE